MERLQFIGMVTEMGSAPKLVVDMSVTHVEGNFPASLDGQQVVQRLRDLADGLEQKLAAQALKG